MLAAVETATAFGSLYERVARDALEHGAPGATVAAAASVALHLTPWSAAAWQDRAWAAARAGDRAAALQASTRALALDPASAYAWQEQAQIYAYFGDLGPAYEARLARAQSLGAGWRQVQYRNALTGAALWESGTPSERLMWGASQRHALEYDFTEFTRDLLRLDLDQSFCREHAADAPYKLRKWCERAAKVRAGCAVENIRPDVLAWCQQNKLAP